MKVCPLKISCFSRDGRNPLGKIKEIQWRRRSPVSGGGVTILAALFAKEFPGLVCFVSSFVSFTRLVPPEDFLCNVAATGMLIFTWKQAKEFYL